MIYLDASYLVRLYIRQPGSDAVEAWLSGKGDWVCSLHGRLEIVSALKRQQREGHIDARGLRAALREMASDEASALLRWLPLPEELVQQACDKVATLPLSLPLRAGDALHLASAADTGVKEIYSHDRHLLAAASHFGLRGIDILASS